MKEYKVLKIVDQDDFERSLAWHTSDRWELKAYQAVPIMEHNHLVWYNVALLEREKPVEDVDVRRPLRVKRGV